MDELELTVPSFLPSRRPPFQASPGSPFSLAVQPLGELSYPFLLLSRLSTLLRLSSRDQQPLASGPKPMPSSSLSRFVHPLCPALSGRAGCWRRLEVTEETRVPRGTIDQARATTKEGAQAPRRGPHLLIVASRTSLALGQTFARQEQLTTHWPYKLAAYLAFSCP
jgi:hypothetical protein